MNTIATILLIVAAPFVQGPAETVIVVETPEGIVRLEGDGAEWLLMQALPVATDGQGVPIADPIR